MNENIFISLDIIKENDIEYFLSYGKFYLHETIKKTFKQKKNINISIFLRLRKNTGNFY